MKTARKIKTRKITLILEEDLLDQAMEQTGKNLTETLRQGLKLLANKSTYEDLRKMRGKVSFSLTAEDVRKARE
jgi:hypothetical protein